MGEVPADYRSLVYAERAEVSPIEMKLDYKPKRININSLRKGHLGELINLFHFEDSKVVLRHATVRGVCPLTR
jgi:autophagy-related protein 2